jgi:Cytochrome P460
LISVALLTHCPLIGDQFQNMLVGAIHLAGIPNNGKSFPDGSKIVKLQWKPKKSTEAPFVVEVPDVFTQAFVIEKDSKRFPKSGGWGYALFNYEAASDRFTADPSPSDCGHACHMAVKAKDYIFHPYQKR